MSPLHWEANGWAIYSLESFWVSVSKETVLVHSDNKSSTVVEMEDDRRHNRLGPKRGEGAVLPLSRESWVPVKHSVAWAEVYFCTKWRLHPFIVWPQ